VRTGKKSVNESQRPPGAGDEALRMKSREFRGLLRGIIAADPGVTREDLLARLGPEGAADAGLLQALEGEGAIRSREQGASKRYYPGRMKLVAPPGSLTGLQMLILKAVQSSEGQSPGRIAKYLEIPKSAVDRQMGRLVTLKVLRAERHLWGTRLFLGEDPGGLGPK